MHISMADIEKAIDMSMELAKHFEGFRPTPYKCSAGVPTIGYGCTCYPNGKKVTMMDRPITEQEALELLRHMLAYFQDGVLQYCPDIKSTGLLAACTDLAYNIGLTAFFGSTLRKVINNGGSVADIAAQFRRWNKGGGKVLNGLVRRREAEIALL